MPPETAILTENPITAPAQKLMSVNDTYTLRYKDRSLIAETHFQFPSTGDKKTDKLNAIKRAQTFCDRMRFRFIHCEQFCIDLDELEARMQSF